MPGLRLQACLWLVAAWAVGCVGPPALDYESRAPDAERGLHNDPAVEARRAEVDAAIARERAETLVDEIELRARYRYDDDDRLELETRVPVRNPKELRAQREVRRAETKAALGRLGETALERQADLCFRSIEGAAHREHISIYDAYATRMKPLLEAHEELRGSGSLSEFAAARFDIEGRIKLANREPRPLPEFEPAVQALPLLGSRPGRLVWTVPTLEEKVSQHHPTVAVHSAISERYQALSERAESRRIPWSRPSSFCRSRSSIRRRAPHCARGWVEAFGDRRTWAAPRPWIRSSRCGGQRGPSTPTRW